MYYVISERENLVSFLPQGAVGAEIGVAQGDFSEVLLDRARPSRLHLIDPWSHLETGNLDAAAYLRGISGLAGEFGPPADNADGDKQYRAVRQRLAGRREVVFNRQFSYKAVREFPDRYFDFVYIDGNHSYEYVFRDLLDFAAKLKDDGLLMGHDFFEDAFASEQHYGVVDAVHSFLRRAAEDYRLMCLTYEPFSSYVIAKKNSGFAGRFLTNLLESDVFLVEMAEEQAFRYVDKHYSRRDGRVRRIPSFAS
ncbi:MAG TPA: class I SAM-dependent methyltransferase [Stellaceae bacterium]|nr:class I SAM-dependent methyltransferase [Stellaceae bacterium]